MAFTESRQSTTLVVTVVFLVISSVFVVLRFVSRVGVVKRVRLDDYFMLAAWIVSLGLSISICYGTTVGLGRHQADVPPEWDSALKKAEYAFSVLYNPALMLTKTSILIFFLQLSTAEKIFKWACIATLFVVNAGGLALTVLNVAQCRPLSSSFKTPIPNDAKCTDIVTLYLASAPLNIITDLAILFLPFPILTSIKLPRKQKIILLVTFGFGVFVAVVDVIRIAYLQEAFMTRIEDVQKNQNTVGADSRNDSDFSWYASISYTWSAVEVDVGIMVACVPALKPLVARFMPRLLRDAGDPEQTLRNSISSAKSNGELQAAHRVPSIPVRHDSTAAEEPTTRMSSEDAMGMMDFLTTPDMDEMPRAQPTQTAMTNTSRHTQPHQSSAFFDFVDMQRKKSMVHMTNREALFPLVMVTVLFFVWGFAYGLLDSLNSQFQKVAHMTAWQTVGIHTAYYGGYFVGPLTFGRLVLKHWGFKACYVIGLAIYACGVLVFWPAAVLTSFPAFLVSNLIVACGLSTLEIAANPFISLCGPQEYMELRLNVSQGVQAIASVLAPLLASKVLFKSANNAGSLTDVQWTYLGISLFTILLAVAFYYVPLPEVTDAELDDAAERSDRANEAQLDLPFSIAGHKRAIKFTTVTLALGSLSQFCYVGGQESVATSFSGYVRETTPYLDVVNYQAVGHAVFAFARFFAAGLNYWIKPRYLLLFFYVGAILFSALCMAGLGPKTNAATLIMVYFFEGPIFALIFAMSLRGLGRRTKDASAALTVAIGGGSVIPPIMHAVITGTSQHYGWSVIIGVYAFGTLLPAWVNGVAPVRRIVDPVKSCDEATASGIDTPPRDAPTTKTPRLRDSIWKRRSRSEVERRSDSGDGGDIEHKEKL